MFNVISCDLAFSAFRGLLHVHKYPHRSLYDICCSGVFGRSMCYIFDRLSNHDLNLLGHSRLVFNLHELFGNRSECLWGLPDRFELL